ncbi:MAG: autotransporter-associated beta strand repeat-containing protein [Verrucomicrobia bacterium]|nr:autotransporter-associated beta strand repeat-containing protein [Verrucomicrobiota bacterium]
MKPRNSIRRILPFPACILAGAIVTHSAHAANQNWDGGGANGNWSTVNNWNDDLAAPGDLASTTNSDIATFNAAIANTWGFTGSPIVIDSATQNLGGISFDTAADNYFIGSTVGNSLLLSSGGTIQILNTLTATAALETINAPLAIQGPGGTYAFTNNSANGAGAGAGTLIIGGGITGAAAGATVLTLNGSNTNANAIGGAISDGAATSLGITKSGTGTWTLSGANSFTGPIAVNDGTLKLVGTQNLPSASLTSNTATSAVVVDAGATVTVGAATLGGGSALSAGAGSILTMGSNNTAVTLNTVATGTGAIALVGNANKTLTSLGAAYDGNIQITASPAYVPNADGQSMQVAITAGGVNAFGSSVGTTTVTNSGTGVLGINAVPSSATPLAENFIFNAGAGVIRFTGTSASTVSGNITINSGTLRLDHGGNWVTYNGIISGAGGIDLINPSEIFTGANTFTGGISEGMGTAYSGVYGVTNGITVGGSDTLSGGAILNGPLGTGTLTFNVASSTWVGTGALRDNGQATTTLHNNVVQRNGMAFRSQTSTTAANTMIVTDAGLTTPSTWTLQPCPNIYTNVPPTASPPVLGTNGSTIPLIMGMNVATNYTAQIDQVIRQDMGATPGNMTLRKVGLGTLVLGRANTYGGDTMAMQGTLKLGVNDALPTGTKLALGGGIYKAADWPELGLVPPAATPLWVNLSNNTTYGTLDLNGFNQTVAGIGQSFDSVVPGNNIITNSSLTTSTFRINNAAANSFGGTISGNLNLIKGAGGTLTLTGASTYSGLTTVAGGRLLVNNASGSGTGSGAVNVDSGATLGGTGAITGAVNVSGVLSPGASVETLASGTLTMNGGSTFQYEVDSSVALVAGADLQKVTGDLALNGIVTLSLTDLAGLPTAFANGTTFSLINYTGAWNSGVFTYNAATLADEGQFTAGLNTWQIDYNAITGGANYANEYAAGKFVNITVIPEPGVALLGGLGLLTLLRRRRNA